MKLTLNQKFVLLLGIFVGLLCAAAYFVMNPLTFASITARTHGNDIKELQMYSFFEATTTTAVSTNLSAGDGWFKIAGAKKVVLYFSRGGATGPNLGNSRFDIDVTPDGTNWYDFSRLFLADKDQTATSTVTVAAGTSTTIASLDLEDQGFVGIRCSVTENTDGEHTCKAQAEF